MSCPLVCPLFSSSTWSSICFIVLTNCDQFGIPTLHRLHQRSDPHFDRGRSFRDGAQLLVQVHENVVGDQHQRGQLSQSIAESPVRDCLQFVILHWRVMVGVGAATRDIIHRSRRWRSSSTCRCTLVAIGHILSTITTVSRLPCDEHWVNHSLHKRHFAPVIRCYRFRCRFAITLHCQQHWLDVGHHISTNSLTGSNVLAVGLYLLGIFRYIKTYSEESS